MAPTLTQLGSWLPTPKETLLDLTFVPAADFDYAAAEEPWRNMTLHYYSQEQVKDFDGYSWSRWTAQNWQIPLGAVLFYLLMIPLLRSLVKEKWSIKRFAVCWNLFLSVFSFCGLAKCFPVLLGELRMNGLYFTICAPAPWYGGGFHGMFVALFIYSKLAELVDTILLSVSKRPVILLHWWHHVTVLLYCWHSYSVQIATGLYYATMNYFVHFLMYAYFAATQTSLRQAVRPFAIYITLLQLAQMVVGIFVTVKAVFYQVSGDDCRVNKTNSLLGLAMYSSYFLLFLKLFLDNYVFSSSKSSSSSSSRKQKASPLPAAAAAKKLD